MSSFKSHSSVSLSLSHSVSRQAEGTGGDQKLHYPVSGQRSLPDQHAGQQCPADAGHPGLAAPPHGVLHQPHLTGRQLTYTEITQMSYIIMATPPLL